MRTALKIIAVAGLVVFGGWLAYSAFQQRSMNSQTEPNLLNDDEAVELAGQREIINVGTMLKLADTDYTLLAGLRDVTGSDGSGTVHAAFTNGEYRLLATFDDLPEPEGDDFYEGWVMRRGPDMSVISTGPLMLEAGGYVNGFVIDRDLTDHDLYVLTIEPNDGDPAPAGHVLEGEFEPVN